MEILPLRRLAGWVALAGGALGAVPLALLVLASALGFHGWPGAGDGGADRPLALPEPVERRATGPGVGLQARLPGVPALVLAGGGVTAAASPSRVATGPSGVTRRRRTPGRDRGGARPGRGTSSPKPTGAAPAPPPDPAPAPPGSVAVPQPPPATPVAAPAPADPATPVVSPSPPPGQEKTFAAGGKTGPVAGKAEQAIALPPGQAKKIAAVARSLPPGRAKKLAAADGTPASPAPAAVPPPAPVASGSLPPGQAKKLGASGPGRKGH